MLPAAGDFELHSRSPPADAWVEVITRHPMSEREVVAALSHCRPSDDVRPKLGHLASDPRVRVVQRQGRRFWTAYCCA